MSDGLPSGASLGCAVCGGLEQAERREWWVANGCGAYAAGTVAGTLTRRYDGLLVALARMYPMLADIRGALAPARRIPARAGEPRAPTPLA